MCVRAEISPCGTTGRHFAIIVDGEASVRRNGRLVATLGPRLLRRARRDRRRAPYGHRHRRSPMVVETLNRREFSLAA